MTVKALRRLLFSRLDELEDLEVNDSEFIDDEVDPVMTIIVDLLICMHLDGWSKENLKNLISYAIEIKI